MTFLLKTTIADLYNLIPVNDVFKALYLIKQKNEIDIIIVDIDNQTKECIDFILHTHTSKLYNQSLIVLSNTENKKIFQSLFEKRVHKYFIKPFNPIQVLKCINELMISLSKSKTLKQ